MTTARERAILRLHEALNHQPFGSEVPMSVSAAIVNDLLEALNEDTEVTFGRLTNARIKHDAQIGKLVRIAELHNVGQFIEAEPIIEELQARRG